MLNRQSFTPQVQDSDGQSNSKHFDKESRELLLSNSCENQSEDDHKSTDDGLDLFTDHQVHLSTSGQWLCSSCMTSDFFFLLLIEIISIAKLLIIVHFFVWKQEKQTLSYIHTKFEGDRNTFFFSPIYFVGAPVFLPQHWKSLGPERLICPWNYLVWIGLSMVNMDRLSICYSCSSFKQMHCVSETSDAFTVD